MPAAPVSTIPFPLGDQPLQERWSPGVPVAPAVQALPRSLRVSSDAFAAVGSRASCASRTAPPRRQGRRAAAAASSGGRQLHRGHGSRSPASTLWAWQRHSRRTDSSRSAIPGSDHYAGLESFANPGVADVELVSDELTAVCPITGQPDLYRVTIGYRPEAALPRVEVAEALPDRASGTRARSARLSPSGSATTSPRRSSCPPTRCGSRSSRRRAAGSRSPPVSSGRADRRRRRPVRRRLARAPAPAPQREVDEVPAATCCPAWVAEMDFALALPIREALLAAVVARRHRLRRRRRGSGARSPGFAAGAFGWEVDPARVRLVADVMSGVAELLRALTEPGDAVVVNPPVYPPFFSVTREVGRRVVEVPLAARRRLGARPRRARAGLRRRRARLPALPPAQPDRARRLERAELEAVARARRAARRHA